MTGDDSWGSGYVVQFNVKNNGAAVLNSWSVNVLVGANDTLVSGWNAQISKSGNIISAKNNAYNGALQPGQSTTFGFQGSQDGSHQTPTCE